MRIKGVYLPDWLFVLIIILAGLIAYFAVPPVRNSVNGIMETLFGPLIDMFSMASSLKTG